MSRGHRVGVGLVALAMLVSGCYGPFTLTKKVHQWNGEVSDNKWIVEGVFLICAWLPVYGIATLADAVIFNSVEFWTGSNPLASASPHGVVRSKRIVRGNSEAIIQQVASAEGQALVINQFDHGQAAGSLRVQRHGDTTIALNEHGDLLFSAQTQPDGSVVVSDAKGARVGSYSSEQIQRLVASATQQ